MKNVEVCKKIKELLKLDFSVRLNSKITYFTDPELLISVVRNNNKISIVFSKETLEGRISYILYKQGRKLVIE